MIIKEDEMIATRIFGPVARELRAKGFSKYYLLRPKYYRKCYMVARVKKNDSVLFFPAKTKVKKVQSLLFHLKKGKVMVKDVALVTRHVKAESKAILQVFVKKKALSIFLECDAGVYSCNKPVELAAKHLKMVKKYVFVFVVKKFFKR